MGKNVAVFVDVANIFYAAKAAGTDIDYVTLLKAATAGRDFVRAYAYTGLDPDNENQRNFHAFLARNHYKVVSKDIRKYGDGKVKANLDIELVVDLMKTARNLDIAIVISGDGDFAPAIRAVQEMGVRVEVISFRGNTSSDLIEVADLFTDITQLARVEKGSSRSGRRVAGDDEDLSMTEVPDKQTEGTGTRGRGRGRGRGRPGEAEPVAARSRSNGRTTTVVGASPAIAAAAGAPVVAASGGSLVALPGEKLSRAASAPAPIESDADEDLETPDGPAVEGEAGEEDGVEGEDGRRRRRRRGGRGRGRGRGRTEDGTPAIAAAGSEAIAEDIEDESLEDEEETPAAAAPRSPRATPFGSFWDSQLGVPSSKPAALTPVGPAGDDEDFDEPEIPEYLIAEQRRGQQQNRGGQGRGGPNRGGARGGRSAYTAAVDRERYGRGGGGGINRYPDVSGRERQGDRQGGGRCSGGGGRPEGGFGRPERQERFDRPAPRSGDPWSEVPPELEEILRAQLAQSPKGRRPEPSALTPAPVPASADDVGAVAETPARRRTTTRRKAADGADQTAATIEAGEAVATTPKRRSASRKAVSADGGSSTADAGNPADAGPKRRTTRKKADAEAGAPSADAIAASGETTVPKRRATRKKADPA